MGMYTELIFGARLKSPLPQNILEILKYMVDENNYNLPIMPDHPFFKISYWYDLFNFDSFNFPTSIKPDLTYDSSEHWNLVTRSNLINRDDIIEKFLDWIKPYIDQGSGLDEFYAIVCCEDQRKPTIYYLFDGEVKEEMF
jgi:hypothetical protein